MYTLSLLAILLLSISCERLPENKPVAEVLSSDNNKNFDPPLKSKEIQKKEDEEFKPTLNLPPSPAFFPGSVLASSDGNTGNNDDDDNENCRDDDGDGVCNELDVCNGFDDNIDIDQDGFPEGCDCDDNNAAFYPGGPCQDDGSDCTEEICDSTGTCLHNNLAAGLPCGNSTDNECTNPDTCDGLGECLSNNSDNGAPCGDGGTECIIQDTCQDGSCVDNGFASVGASCGDSSDTECLNPDTCDGFGSCLNNDEQDGFPCGDGGTECIVQDTCQSGTCIDNGFVSAGASCGNMSAGLCDLDDTCDGFGSCQDHKSDSSTECRASANSCDLAEFCDGSNNDCPADLMDTTDTDSDSIPDCQDNCPMLANMNQADADSDGIGATCDCDDNNALAGNITGTPRYVSPMGTDVPDCTSQASPCQSIAFAISQATAGDTIILTAGTFNEQGIFVNKNLNFIGEGPGTTTVLSNGSDRVFNHSAGRNVSYCALSIAGGVTMGDGGGIFSTNGSLRVSNAEVRNSQAKEGGGIYKSGGTLNIDNSAISFNTGGFSFGGGGISNLSATAVISKSTINDNVALGGGGGGMANVGGNTTIIESLFTKNRSSFGGGGFYNTGASQVTNSTFSENTATNSGGGIFTDSLASATLRLNNSTITLNSATTGGGLRAQNPSAAQVSVSHTIIGDQLTGGNCSLASSLTSGGHNIDSASSCNFIAPFDLQTTAPLLLPLANNGGPTMTHLPTLASPAIDAGALDCGVPNDQRGAPRPIDTPAIAPIDALSRCDIGAVELP